MVALDVAGILFAIAGSDCSVRCEHEPAYEAFLTHTTCTVPDISVNVVVGGLPDISVAKRLFSSGSSWYLSADEGCYYLVLDPLTTDETPLYVARFDIPLKTVTIFCREQLAVQEGDNLCIPNPLRYPLDQMLLMYYLAGQGGSILHAAGVGINNKGYLFPGRSGAGKSTLARQLLARQCGEVLSDDRMVMRKVDGAFTAYGTPWPGDAGIAVNKSVPLSGIFFISHGNDNRIKRLERREAFEMLLPVTSVPWYDRDITEKLLASCDDMVSHVPAYELSFKPTDEVVDILGNFSVQ